MEHSRLDEFKKEFNIADALIFSGENRHDAKAKRDTYFQDKKTFLSSNPHVILLFKNNEILQRYNNTNWINLKVNAKHESKMKPMKEELVVYKEGKDGRDGLNGKDGIDGKSGKDGLPGKDGKDGRGIARGGLINQKLIKSGDQDFDTKWVNDVCELDSKAHYLKDAIVLQSADYWYPVFNILLDPGHWFISANLEVDLHKSLFSTPTTLFKLVQGDIVYRLTKHPSFNVTIQVDKPEIITLMAKVSKGSDKSMILSKLDDFEQCTVLNAIRLK